ncbi:MAG TPA: hypothetical protein VGN82_10395 [Bosea sp. (in: a-proteobacteria)]|jgi:hypothetical protein|uniref:hypothetical protein n=1 Tax=Bosea sp. (in: a-proteobacteria) TaxID=1871050 RepID=UPI002E0E75E1|nr:hypothetical protein [Bosea sp. (in: a-proteobacteria)]
MVAHVVLERASFPPRRPALTLAQGRRFVARRVPALRQGFGSAAMLGLRFVQARLISVWGLLVAAIFCPPHIFAAFAVFSAAATFISIAALLRLEAVFFRNGDRTQLGLAFRLAMACGAAFLGLAAVVLAILVGIGRIAPAIALIFFVSLSARAVLRLLWAEATAEGDFRAIGNSNLVQALVQPVLMLLLIAIFGPKALALFLADALGNATAAVYLAKRRRDSLLALAQPREWSRRGLLWAARRWRDAPRILLPSALLSYGFTVAPLLALPYAANPLLAAHVALAMRLLDVPTQMFGTMSGPLLLNRLRTREGSRRQFWVRLATLGLVAAAIALFVPIAIGAHLFGGVFDDTKWEGVGDVIAVMTLFYGGIALFNPLHDIAALARDTTWQLAANIIAFVAIVAAILWFGALSSQLLYAVGVISVARAAAHALFVWIGQGEASARDNEHVPGARGAR